MSSRLPIARIMTFLVTIILLSGLVVAFINRFWIYDQIMISRFPPSAAAQQLASATTMTPAAMTMFYGARSDLADADNFKQHCSGEEARTIILGCYVTGQIYILNVNDERIRDVEEVTAAHEMLHVVYERLDDGEREKLNALLETAYQHVKDPRLEELMASYAESEPTEHYNELHSILGTEYDNLGPGLEAHYAEFLQSRATVTAMAHSYQAVFDNLKQQQETLIKELQQLAQLIDRQTQSYNDELAAFNADVDDFNVRASAGNGSYSELTRERNQLIAQQERLENLRANILQQRDEYERKREQYNQLVVTSESLQSSLKGLANPAERL